MVVRDLFEFFGSQAGTEVLRIADSALSLIVLLVSGRALSNTVQLKKAIGNTLEHGPLHTLTGLFRRGPKHGRSTSATLVQPQVSIQEQLDGLKNTYENNWVRTGIRLTDAEKRLDRIDPKRKRLP